MTVWYQSHNNTQQTIAQENALKEKIAEFEHQQKLKQLDQVHELHVRELENTVKMKEREQAHELLLREKACRVHRSHQICVPCRQLQKKNGSANTNAGRIAPVNAAMCRARGHGEGTGAQARNCPARTQVCRTGGVKARPVSPDVATRTLVKRP